MSAISAQQHAATMSCDALPGFDQGVEFGRLLAHKSEAWRCLAIMLSTAASARPVAAWSLLPQGRDEAATIAHLATAPIEAVPLDPECGGMQALRDRYVHAVLAIAEFEASYVGLKH